jgi:hypothetical protein
MEMAFPDDEEPCVLQHDTPESALDGNAEVLLLVKCSAQLLGSNLPLRRRSCEGRRSRSDSLDGDVREVSVECTHLEGAALEGRLIGAAGRIRCLVLGNGLS